ncbi:MAG: hypothetical protein M1827_005751 [Pycnora praestabilis]|nr:MAG: hypothetical protein M1827_005751 [Pycnora praestabilis]
MSKSCSNEFEVEMVAGLVEYLVAGNEYNLNDIAILTPYNGQLAALTRRLSSICYIWLSDKDRDTLLRNDLLSQELAVAGMRARVSVLDMLRVATV